MKNVLGKPNFDPETKRDVGYPSFPVGKFKVPVNVEAAKANGVGTANDTLVNEIRFEIPESKLQGGLVRSDFIILNIIASNAANGWKRPIYFTSPYGELGFGQYLRKDGLAYRLVPVQTKSPQINWTTDVALRELRLGGTQIRDNNTDVLYNNLMTKYLFGGADKKGMYFDEENRRHILNIRALYAEAAGNMADAGKKAEALNLLDKVEKGIHTDNLPYAMTSRYNSHNQTTLLYLEACYKAGKLDLAEKVRTALRKDLEQQRAYYEYIRESRPELFGGYERSEAPINEIMLEALSRVEQRYAPQTGTKPTTEGPTTITNPARPDTTTSLDTNR